MRNFLMKSSAVDFKWVWKEPHPVATGVHMVFAQDAVR
jgi:hypothetical protein